MSDMSAVLNMNRAARRLMARLHAAGWVALPSIVTPAQRARRRARREQSRLERLRARHARPRATKRQVARVLKAEARARMLEEMR